uniref:Uncharacterized protein n=1 Tax=Arundo donax TaxID=35708 RepID=A0A0A9HXP1_ARUDO
MPDLVAGMVIMLARSRSCPQFSMLSETVKKLLLYYYSTTIFWQTQICWR